ncbi:MAG: DUF1761 domain-containing protein [Spirochaetaceae bacterium]|nr:DUF1761 domain-containing protein [Spirochaetaceae bacterium]
MQFLAVNWLAVLVAAIVNMVVGFLWYGPLFSGLFLRLIGKREEDIEASPLVYPLGFVMGLVTTYVLAVIIGSAGVTTWWEGAVAGAVVWIAIGALTSANTILYEDRPVGLWLLFSSYQLVVLTIAGVLFAVWR